MIGAYWLGFILGGFAIMSLFTVSKAGVPGWLFFAVMLWFSLAIATVAERRRTKAEERDLILHRLGHE